MITDAAAAFYSETPEQRRGWLVENLLPVSNTIFDTPCTSDDWAYWPCFYVKCGRDEASIESDQDRNISRLAHMEVMDMPESDHFPFESYSGDLILLAIKMVNIVTERPIMLL